MAERPEREKFDQAEVHYERRSTHLFQRCRNCKHFIRPNRCESVKSPIAPAGWCVRYEKKGD